MTKQKAIDYVTDDAVPKRLKGAYGPVTKDAAEEMLASDWPPEHKRRIVRDTKLDAEDVKVILHPPITHEEAVRRGLHR